MPVVGDHQLDPRPLDADAHLHDGARLAVLDGVLDEVAERRHELAAVAEHARRPSGTSSTVDVDRAAPRRAGAARSTAPSTTSATSTTSRTGSSPSSMRDSSSRSSIVRGDAVRLVDHPLGDAVDDVEVVLVGERLGEHGERADRRLQLVADVGDEVGAHGVDAAPLADVLDRRHARRRPAAARRVTTTAIRGGPYSSSVWRDSLAVEGAAAACRSTASSTSTPDVRAGQRAGGRGCGSGSRPLGAGDDDAERRAGRRRRSIAAPRRRPSRGAAAVGVGDRRSGGRGVGRTHHARRPGRRRRALAIATSDDHVGVDGCAVTPGRSPRPASRSAPRRRARASSR